MAYSDADIAYHLFSRLHEMNVVYDDVTKFMLDHLDLEERLKEKAIMNKNEISNNSNRFQSLRKLIVCLGEGCAG
ncbi:hypothetical protein A3842_27935 [Paenibacillus sp. P3E]|uniref:hypothetical protein n=1 Tax=Paenibacillus sp. P3E TaxID=1349435 RepID=UPI00093B6F65|nr:hypothetical protein [Paenibacillus sp. P3E]OKP67708.1 hypothetical protein A3842_27935 [Paenibacillus sp. P3E]